MPLMTFAQALDADAGAGGRTVLLGNGFSRAFSDDFGYGRLRDAATMPALSVDRDTLFDEIGSDDFETVMDRLRRTARMVALYSPRSTRTVDRLGADALVVQRGLVDALSAIHPASASAVSDEEYAHAAGFLSHFARIFTVNYDLLLYWAVLHADGRAPRNDGFIRAGSMGLRWDSRGRPGRQCVFYLHGAVHLYADGAHVRKLDAVSGERLLLQLERNLAKGRYPLVVTEGSRADKEARIARSPYLSHAHEQLAATTGTLFVHGLSLSENDGHLLDAIAHRESRVERLYVGLHGAASAKDRRHVRDRAGDLASDRAENGGDPLTVSFYDAGSAHVWR